MEGNVAIGFQGFQVAGQVAIRELETAAKGIVIYPLIGDEQCHDAKTISVVEGRIEL